MWDKPEITQACFVICNNMNQPNIRVEEDFQLSSIPMQKRVIYIDKKIYLCYNLLLIYLFV
ncbi:hypothetical protein STFR1_30455 [Bacillus vallismortis]